MSTVQLLQTNQATGHVSQAQAQIMQAQTQAQTQAQLAPQSGHLLGLQEPVYHLPAHHHQEQANQQRQDLYQYDWGWETQRAKLLEVPQKEECGAISFPGKNKKIHPSHGFFQ